MDQRATKVDSDDDDEADVFRQRAALSFMWVVEYVVPHAVVEGVRTKKRNLFTINIL
jgi:hypothetical protein